MHLKMSLAEISGYGKDTIQEEIDEREARRVYADLLSDMAYYQAEIENTPADSEKNIEKIETAKVNLANTLTDLEQAEKDMDDAGEKLKIAHEKKYAHLK